MLPKASQHFHSVMVHRVDEMLAVDFNQGGEVEAVKAHFCLHSDGSIYPGDISFYVSAVPGVRGDAPGFRHSGRCVPGRQVRAPLHSFFAFESRLHCECLLL